MFPKFSALFYSAGHGAIMNFSFLLFVSLYFVKLFHPCLFYSHISTLFLSGQIFECLDKTCLVWNPSLTTRPWNIKNLYLFWQKSIILFSLLLFSILFQAYFCLFVILKKKKRLTTERSIMWPEQKRQKKRSVNLDTNEVTNV